MNAIITILFLFLFTNSYSCTCIQTGKVNIYKDYDVVFYGYVINEKTVYRYKDSIIFIMGTDTIFDKINDYEKEYTFVNIKGYKNANKDTLLVRTAMDGNLCGETFEKQNLYLIFCRRELSYFGSPNGGSCCNYTDTCTPNCVYPDKDFIDNINYLNKKERKKISTILKNIFEYIFY
ncbi:MAG: hypothetical protein JNM36_08525 [Chitinophagales bacterium]|nr:hypothetical protein [Chitinophagales bacterium]